MRKMVIHVFQTGTLQVSLMHEKHTCIVFVIIDVTRIHIFRPFIRVQISHLEHGSRYVCDYIGRQQSLLLLLLLLSNALFPC